MKKHCIAGIIIGVLILFLSVPLGELYGGAYCLFSGIMEQERYLMLSQSAITAIQMIGGIVSLLCGMTYILHIISYMGNRRNNAESLIIQLGQVISIACSIILWSSWLCSVSAAR